ncbi:hypothetical protein ABE525_12365 [Pseudomonas wadenswilerensis]|uniref:DUF3887 domain-containing protein n=2 Tax=Pseudomonas TaxID=286 RepID=A0A5E6PU62_PSEFL|nr:MULTISPECIES: hypothetical protein [Pseudomonas]SUQ63266.1 hypothetical protein CCOS864_02716 [Pseudomonas wadenswilerensis]VVM45052.1 hypothetical protein PS652_00474 [Pseudomonas fluorescens]
MKLAVGVTCAMLLAMTSLARAEHLEGQVREAIEAAMQGECSEVLSTMVKASCEGQIDRMTQALSQLGPLASVEFKGNEDTPSGSAEVYQATHANGKMLWLAIKAPSGKLSMFWSPGPQ